MVGILINIVFTLSNVFPVWKIWAIDQETLQVSSNTVATDGQNIITGLTAGKAYIIALIPDVQGRWFANTALPERIGAVASDNTAYGYEAQAWTGTASSGAIEPVWPTGLGDSVVDGDITWVNIGTLPDIMTQGPLIAAVME